VLKPSRAIGRVSGELKPSFLRSPLSPPSGPIDGLPYITDIPVCLIDASNSKIWSWVPWNSEQRITVLARASSNLAVSQSVSQMPQKHRILLIECIYLFRMILKKAVIITVVCEPIV
jgi:hypothetical protein